MQFLIDAAKDGITVRDFLRSIGVSAALAAKLKRRERGIVQNGVRVTVRAVLHAGDTLDLAVEDETGNEKILPLAKSLEIVLETEDLLVVNKPPFMPTHPSHGHFTDTLANALVYHCGEGFRPRFVNRLDRNTSGGVLVAKHAFAAAKLSSAMAQGLIQKTYFAVACGKVEAETVLKTGIRRREESIIFREVCKSDEGDLAITHITPLATKGTLTLLRLTPKTGRTHQLRVHMAHLGATLLGDDLYGMRDTRLPRHALHAASLSFPDPTSGETVRAFAPIAPDMAALITKEFGEEALDLVKKI